nr:hypothetical protein [uncultured Anaerostipes sp.]
MGKTVKFGTIFKAGKKYIRQRELFHVLKAGRLWYTVGSEEF